VDAYLDFFRAHPALAAAWNPGIEEYVRYDATGPAGTIRSRAQEAAVREDGRWLLTESGPIGAALARIKSPLSLLRAPRGLLDQPVGLLPDALTAEWTARLPGLGAEIVPDCNHYTIVFDERCVRTVVDRLTQDQS
jgi:hypothetical protein